MTGEMVGLLVLWLIVAIIVIVVVVYLLNWLYFRSNREMAFVRTGLGGEKVVINSGAFVLPIIHEVTQVNLNVVRIPVAKTKHNALISRDRMRVDIEAEFFVRVVQQSESVSRAASTLGRRTTDPEQLNKLLSGKFVGALQSVASELTLDEMHENRENMQTRLEDRAKTSLAQNGLELESVAITDLNQTDLEFFNPANRFDAEGMTELIETIETRRKLRNDIEQSSMVAIRARNLEAEKEALKLEQESESSRLEQERVIEAMRAAQKASIQKARVAQEAEAEQARIETEHTTKEKEIARRSTLEAAEIAANEEVEKARIMHERTLEKERIAREKSIRSEQIKQRQSIEQEEISLNEELERAKIISQRQIEQTRIQADEETESREITRNKELESEKIEASKFVEQARIEQEKILQKARVERDQIIRTEQIAQDKTIQEAEITAHEEIEKARIASERDVHAVRIEKERELRRLEVEREAVFELAVIERQISILNKQSDEQSARIDFETVRAKAIEAEEQVNTSREKEIAERTASIDKLIATKDAEIKKIKAEADKLTAEVEIEAQRLLYEAENLLSDNARTGLLRDKLIERLEGIIRESAKPMEQIDGIKILHVDGLGNAGNGQKLSPTDEVIDSVLRYRAQAPLIDEMMKEVGIENPNVARGMSDIFRAAKDAKGLVQPTNNGRAPAEPDGNDPEKSPKE